MDRGFFGQKSTERSTEVSAGRKASEDGTKLIVFFETSRVSRRFAFASPTFNSCDTARGLEVRG